MSHLITDYCARGLDAAKPGSPNIGAGETGFYWATDTLKLYGWTGAAWAQVNTGTGGPSIVQVASMAGASHAPGVVLAGAPTAGNLLVAFASDQATAPSINTAAGWSSLGTASAAQDGYGIAIRLAQGGDSATQIPFNDTHQGTATVYEVNNASGGLPSFALGFSGTAVAETPNNTKATGSGGIILGVFVNRTTVGPTSITGTGVTADTAGNVTGVGRAVAPFHISGATNGLNTVTANYATSQGGMFAAICVG